MLERLCKLAKGTGKQRPSARRTSVVCICCPQLSPAEPGPGPRPKREAAKLGRWPVDALFASEPRATGTGVVLAPAQVHVWIQWRPANHTSFGNSWQKVLS